MTAVIPPGERIAVPDGYKLFLKSGRTAPGIPAHGVSVVILPAGFRSVMEAMAGAPNCHVAVTHERGQIWPDSFGVQLVDAALSGGWTAVLQFKCAADARRCCDLLRASAAATGEARR